MSEPKYRGIEQWLRDQCATLGPGGVLPSEVEAGERFQVSRMTARRAYTNLVAAGLIERRRGVGSVVLSQPLHREESVLRSFSSDMRRRGMRASSRILHTELGLDPNAAHELGLSADAWIVTIRRLRLADDVPLAIEHVALPGHYAAVLEADLENGSLFEALHAMGRTLERASGYVTARLSTAEESELLRLEPPAALLVETRLITDATGQPVESTRTAYAGPRWAIDTGVFVVGPPEASL